MPVTGEQRTGIVIVSHGSRRAQANEGFLGLVDRIAIRLQGTPVYAAFFSLAEPSIESRLDALYRQGIRRVALLPYFLFRGQHTSGDIPALLEACRARFPDLALDLLPTLENDPAVEDLLVDRLPGLFPQRLDVVLENRLAGILPHLQTGKAPEGR